MAKNVLERLCEAIAYPEPVPAGAVQARLRVDGGDVMARIIGRRLVLSREIDRDENDIGQLAIYAAGRILREEAVLAWDERAGVCIIWQEIQDNAEASELVHFFEAFMTSCDWWLARAVELNAPPPSFPDIVIRP